MTVTSERCHVCDAVLATEADTDTLSGLTLMALCWSSLIGAPCNRPPVDWRARALAAESACKAIEQQRIDAEAMVLALETDVSTLERRVLAAEAERDKQAAGHARYVEFLRMIEGDIRRSLAESRTAEARLRARDIVCIPDEQVEMVRGYIAGVDRMDVPVVDVEVMLSDAFRELDLFQSIAANIELHQRIADWGCDRGISGPWLLRPPGDDDAWLSRKPGMFGQVWYGSRAAAAHAMGLMRSRQRCGPDYAGGPWRDRGIDP